MQIKSIKSQRYVVQSFIEVGTYQFMNDLIRCGPLGDKRAKDSECRLLEVAVVAIQGLLHLLVELLGGLVSLLLSLRYLADALLDHLSSGGSNILAIVPMQRRVTKTLVSQSSL